MPPKKIGKFISKDAFVRSGNGQWDQVNPRTIKTLAKRSKIRVSKDKEFQRFLADQREVRLSKELIDEILEAIRKDRDAMIEEAKINYPLKTFQGVDTDLRYAIIMPNLSSEYCPSDKGKIKHVELKLGLVVPKPMQKSFYAAAHSSRHNC